MTENKTLAPLSAAELDLVGAGTGFRSINLFNAVFAVQGNSSTQGSLNVVTLLSGNQAVSQGNNASIG